MSEISKIQLPSGSIYDIKDSVAREMAAGTIHLVEGTCTTPLEDKATTNPIIINDESYTAKKADAVIYINKEFVFDGTQWHEFGDLTGLGDLAFKNSASGNFTPAGTVSQPTFTGEEMTSTGTVAATGTVSQPTFTGDEMTSTGSVTAAGTVSQPTFTGDEMTSTGTFQPTGTVSQPTFEGAQGNVSVSGTPAGSIGVGAGTANYTPAGTVSAPNVTVTPTKDNTGYMASSATGGGSVTPGAAAQATMPDLAMTVENETLSLSWTPGSFTPNTPTAVTLPTFAAKEVVTDIESATASVPTFTGTGVDLEFTGTAMNSTGKFTPEGTVSQPTFSGNTGNVSVSGTPEGTVSQPTFTGSAADVSVTGTPTGTVSQPTFSGTEASVTVKGTPAGEVSQPTFSGTAGNVTVS